MGFTSTLAPLSFFRFVLCILYVDGHLLFFNFSTSVDLTQCDSVLTAPFNTRHGQPSQKKFLTEGLCQPLTLHAFSTFCVPLCAGSLVAVRLGPWKLHFVTKGSHCNNDFPDSECYAPSTDRRSSGGLLFNVERDMSEVLPLKNTSYEYQLWAPVLWQMALEYTENIFTEAERPPSQIGRGGSVDRFPCCNTCTPMPDCCSCNRTSPVYV